MLSNNGHNLLIYLILQFAKSSCNQKLIKNCLEKGNERFENSSEIIGFRRF